MYILLSIEFYICYGCPKEPSHLDGSFDSPQHLIGLKNDKNENENDKSQHHTFFSCIFIIWQFGLGRVGSMYSDK